MAASEPDLRPSRAGAQPALREHESMRLDHLRGKPEDFISLADAQLIFNGDVLPVHRAILANASAWFRSLFSALQEKVAVCEEIKIPHDQFEDVGLTDFCSFLRCLYTPTVTVVREELVQVQRDEGKVVFETRLESLLQLSHYFDAPSIFPLIDQVAAQDPICRLSQLMDPLRWLLASDAYSHLGYLGDTRATAISFLTAKFTTMQSDPRLERLSPPTLCEVVRMAAFRLASLSTTCGHVHAVQDRAVQRFMASAQQVAADMFPSEASPLITRWWHNSSTQTISLSWVAANPAALDGGDELEGVAALEEHEPPAVQQPLPLALPVPLPVPAASQQGQHGGAVGVAAWQAQQAGSVGWFPETQALHQLLGQVSTVQHAQHEQQGGSSCEEGSSAGGAAAAMELEELVHEVEGYPSWVGMAQRAGRAQQAQQAEHDDHTHADVGANPATSAASPPPSPPQRIRGALVAQCAAWQMLCLLR